MVSTKHQTEANGPEQGGTFLNLSNTNVLISVAERFAIVLLICPSSITAMSLQRAQMSDFDRFKVMKAKRMVSGVNIMSQTLLLM